jgi:hypothetical protein
MALQAMDIENVFRRYHRARIISALRCHSYTSAAVGHVRARRLLQDPCKDKKRRLTYHHDSTQSGAASTASS